MVSVRVCEGGGGRRRRHPGIQNQKQEPHTKMWGIQPGLAPLPPGGTEHHHKSAAGSSAAAAPGQILHDCPLRGQIHINDFQFVCC